MLTLIGRKSDSRFEEIQQKLDSLSVTYVIKYTKDKPYLKDGELQVKFFDEMKEYFLELEDELRKWHYCSI